LVHTVDAFALSDLEKDEAFVAPVLAPGVLNLPVVFVAVGVLQAASVIGLVLAGVPPLVDRAVFVDRLGVRLRARVRVVFTGLVLVADDDDAVVETSALRSVEGNDALFVEREGILASVDGDGERVRLQLLLDLIDAIFELAPPRDVADRLAAVVFARLILCGVGVVAVKHDALILLELPSVRHPAAIAAIIFVRLAKHFSRAGIVPGAIDEMLLGQALRRVHCSEGDLTLERRVGVEGPAGTARALILHWGHSAIGCVIDSRGLCDQAASRSPALLILRAEPG